MSNNNLSEQGEPIPFIQIDEKSGSFEVNSQAMMFLDSLPRNMKVSIVSIAGPYRTGKSFLANRLLNQNKGFEIGSTTQACTKGIWIWNKPIQVQPDQIMLLIDTEGLASTERSTNVDIKIFSMAILLSSVFIYNQMGPINEMALEDLSLVANLTTYIHIQSNQQKETGNEFKQYFPSFFWVLRDFYHDLEGQTPKQYLEECLQPSSGLSTDVMKKNKIRDSITKYFKDRECFTFIRPVADESKLAHIEDLKWEELKSDFRKEVTTFVQSVKRKLKPKVINGKVLNASMFLSLALEYTEAINSKETPTVLTAIDRVVQAEAMKIQDEYQEKLKADLDEQINEENVPFAKEDIRKIIKKITKSNINQMQKQLGQILNFSEILQETTKFQQRIQDVIDSKIQLNYSASYHYSLGLIKKLYSTVENPFEGQSLKIQYDSMVIHDYIRKWISIVKEYKDLGKCAIQWELFAESLVKLADQNSFIRRELIDFEQENLKELGEDHDDMSSEQPNTKQILLNSYAFNIFEKFIDSILEMMNEQLNRLKINLNEAQSNERKLSQQKKSNDQMIELQRQQNEELVSIKHEYEMKIENLKREISSRMQELDSLKQVKDMEIKNLKRNQEKQLKDKEDEIKQLESAKIQSEQIYNTTSKKVQELESEKIKEVSQIQNEIKKLEEDIEGLKNKVKNKENNPFYIQVNQFFGEVKEYIEEYKKIFEEATGQQKNPKMQLFSLQKRLNDVDYQSNQSELKLKKQLDENLRQKKEELEREFDSKFQEVEQERSKLQQLQERKIFFDQQLELILMQVQEAKEKQMNLIDHREAQQRSVKLKRDKLQDLHKEIKEKEEIQSQLEDTIYKISIENKEKQEDKEQLFIILPQIYKAIMGKSNNLKSFLNQIESDLLRNKVIKILQNYKIPFK